MNITLSELVGMRACVGGVERFIEQTGAKDHQPVDVVSLVGGKNTTSDLLWLAGRKLPKNKIVRFACDCALLNVEKIKPYTNKYDQIVAFLRCPVPDAARAAAYAADAAADAAYAALAVNGLLRGLFS